MSDNFNTACVSQWGLGDFISCMNDLHIFRSVNLRSQDKFWESIHKLNTLNNQPSLNLHKYSHPIIVSVASILGDADRV